MKRIETKIPPIFLTAFGAFLTYLLSLIDPLLMEMQVLKVVAVAPMIIGSTIALSGVHSFIKARTTINPHSIHKASSFVATGLYTYTRNPMYLGMILVHFGFALWRGSILGLLLGGATSLFLLTHLQILPEEKFLQKKFGQTYEQYCTRVRRWL